jgi:hypothetical protein
VSKPLRTITLPPNLKRFKREPPSRNRLPLLLLPLFHLLPKRKPIDFRELDILESVLIQKELRPS